jgi:DNA gyrase subunit A
VKDKPIQILLNNGVKMLNLERPDLSQVAPSVKAYIEALEAELARLKPRKEQNLTVSQVSTEPEIFEPGELPNTLSLITVSHLGQIKRTSRHLYQRQRRGGMGVFDLETSGEDYPDHLCIADESQHLLVFTNLAHVYRLPVAKLSFSQVRSRGQELTDLINLEPDERPVTLLPDQASGYVAMVTRKGVVRWLRHHLFGEHMRPGTSFINVGEAGELVSACWTPGDADLFVCTQQGIAIRFSEKLISPKGDNAIRLAEDDQAVAITAVRQDSGVFLISSDGKGTVRSMEGFAPNKSSGGSGKLAIKSTHIVSAVAIDQAQDIFILSRLGKIIRFRADEVPPSEGVVQGVVCMSLRGDEITAVAKATQAPPASFR